MSTVWAQRREELLSDCLVSPDVFNQMVDRLGEFVVPYQQALETEAGQHPMHLYLQGLLSHLPRQECRGHRDVRRCRATGHPRLHRHRAMGPSAVDHGVGRTSGRSVGRTRWHHRLRSQQFPQARHAFGGRQTAMVRPPGQGRQLPGRCVHGLRLSTTTMPCSTSACPCLRSGHATSNDARNATCHRRCAIKRDRSSAWRCSTRGGIRCRTAGSRVMMSWVATRGFATSCASAVSAMCWGCPATPRFATWRRRCPSTQGVDGGPKPRGNR